MKNKIIILALFAISAISCSRKQVPQTVTPAPVVVVHTDCDSLIEAALESIALNPDFGDADAQIVGLSERLSETQVQLAECSTQLAMKPTTADVIQPCPPSRIKIKNSFNEETKLKNSMQIKDATIDGLTLENVALRGKLKQSNDSISKLIAKKGSAIGNNNDLDNSKKGVGWFWIFVGGYLFCHVLHKLIIPAAMRFIPFANLGTKIKSVFKIFTS